jgi:hypothetical protein
MEAVYAAQNMKCVAVEKLADWKKVKFRKRIIGELEDPVLNGAEGKIEHVGKRRRGERAGEWRRQRAAKTPDTATCNMRGQVVKATDENECKAMEEEKVEEKNAGLATSRASYANDGGSSSQSPSSKSHNDTPRFANDGNRSFTSFNGNPSYSSSANDGNLSFTSCGESINAKEVTTSFTTEKKSRLACNDESDESKCSNDTVRNWI